MSNNVVNCSVMISAEIERADMSKKNPIFKQLMQ